MTIGHHHSCLRRGKKGRQFTAADGQAYSTTYVHVEHVRASSIGDADGEDERRKSLSKNPVGLRRTYNSLTPCPRRQCREGVSE